MSHLGCCALGVCCQGGDQQAAALATEVPMTRDAARRLAEDGMILIPKTIEHTVEALAPAVEKSAQRLSKLRRYARAELAAIMSAMGHVVEMVEEEE